MKILTSGGHLESKLVHFERVQQVTGGIILIHEIIGESLDLCTKATLPHRSHVFKRKKAYQVPRTNA